MRTLDLSVLAAIGLAATSQSVHAERTVHVATARELESAVEFADRTGGNMTIALASGTYTLDRTLSVDVPHVTLAGDAGLHSRQFVVIQGDAMSAHARVGNIIRVSGSYFELRNMTVQRSRLHLIQIAGESAAEAPFIHDCILRDAYEQMIKVSRDPAHPNKTSDHGTVEDCIFEYSAGIGPQYYIGGIDAHGARHWTVRNNTFRNIASPAGQVAEFAIHFWDGSADDLVERNLLENCDRGIGFGLDGEPNRGGIIRNNVIYHAARTGPFADVGIALTDSAGTQIYHNTVIVEQNYAHSIEYRFPDTRNVLIRNNLVNRPIATRDGATGTVTDNVEAGAPPSTLRIK